MANYLERLVTSGARTGPTAQPAPPIVPPLPVLGRAMVSTPRPMDPDSLPDPLSVGPPPARERESTRASTPTRPAAAIEQPLPALGSDEVTGLAPNQVSRATTADMPEGTSPGEGPRRPHRVAPTAPTPPLARDPRVHRGPIIQAARGLLPDVVTAADSPAPISTARHRLTSPVSEAGSPGAASPA